MITRLVQKFRKPPRAGTAPFLPQGQRVYCIGDIHGRADLLRELHAMILADAQGFEGIKYAVYLGDYVDRGWHTRQVIDMLLAGPLPDFEPVYLQGNHEQIMLSFIEHPDLNFSWLLFGGREALNSYGIPLAQVPAQQDLSEIAGQLDRALPDSHREFLQNGLHHWRCGSYYFVHAGIRPGLDLDVQTPEDQLWIRNEFLDSTADHGAIVVHGHSMVAEPEFRPNRIGIDTGAYASGVLTCLVLEGDRQRILHTG